MVNGKGESCDNIWVEGFNDDAPLVLAVRGIDRHTHALTQAPACIEGIDQTLWQHWVLGKPGLRCPPLITGTSGCRGRKVALLWVDSSQH